MDKELSIVLVNYKTPKLTEDCIKSIYEKTEGLDYDIYVVDNASDDGIGEILKEKYPEVKFIQSETNNGFGAGNNIALRVINSKYVFLLNTDTLLKNNAIKILHDYLEQNPNVGACGGNLYDENGKNIHSYGNFLNLTDQLVKAFGLRLFFPSRLRRMNNKGKNQKEELKPVDYITGADLMIRKEALDKAGLFDERFFMYYEETELQFRIHKAGYEIYIVPDAKITHLHDQSPKKRDKMYFELLKSRYLFSKYSYGTKENLWLIKLISYINMSKKILSRFSSVYSLYCYLRKDKLED